MSNVPKLTLRGLYDYTDGHIFDLLQIPEGLSESEFIKRLLYTRGELGVLFPDPDWLKEAIGSWSINWLGNFTRIYQTLEAQYNPIHNYDRHEEYTDTEGIERSGTTSGTGSISTTSGTDMAAENLVSAFNESTYQPDTKTVSGSDTETETETESSEERGENVDRSLEHYGHLYGNIGTTKSQEMVADEVNIRLKLGIFDIMSDVFAQELLLLVY